MTNLGKLIQTRRNELRLTQQEIADLVGVSEMSISRYERWPDDEEKGRQPRFDEITKIAKALKVDPSYFWSGRTEIPKSLIAGMRKVPLMPLEFTVCCGPGNGYSEVPMAQELIDVPDSMIGHVFDDMRPPYAVRAEGESMICAGISPHSIVIINPAETINTGDIALIRAGDNWFIKRVKWERGGGITLLSDGANQMTISFNNEDLKSEWVAICGKATGVMNRL